jgi:SAM-dependent methyltransferase
MMRKAHHESTRTAHHRKSLTAAHAPDVRHNTAKESRLGRFGDDPHAFFGNVYSDIAPWEVGGAQPDMARMLEDYPPADPVLDLGSATGDLAMALASQGHDVVGLEFVQAAVDRAYEKASALAPEVGVRLRFEVGDASRPSALGVRFGAVLDSGFLHLLDPEETDDFVADLREALAPGGRYYLHEFAIEFPIENVPRAITEEEIRARFNPDSGWRVLEARPAVFHNRVAQPTSAIVACIERLEG